MNSRLLLSCLLAAGLPSCSLVKVPFRVAGGVVKGTTTVGKAGYNASKKAFTKSDEEKAKEKKEKAEKAQKEADEEKAKRAAETGRHADATKQQQGLQQQPQDPSTSAGDTLPPLPPDSTPLPLDEPVPYQNQ
jgi:isoaspartyl peptidase/L-asparaginase-like protein (Ntn-hydrolase superfamily)